MNHGFLIGALLLSACGEETTKQAEPPVQDAPAAAKPAPAAEHTADQMFIDGMVPHHEGAVEMARLAQQRAEHPELEAMGEAMVTAQQAEIDQMKGWRKTWFGSDQTPPMGAPMEHGDMPGMKNMEGMKADMERLKTASPFDLAFLDVMITHHQGAVQMATDAQSKSERPEVKELAAKITADQKKEIEQMKQWRTAWYPEAP